MSLKCTELVRTFVTKIKCKKPDIFFSGVKNWQQDLLKQFFFWKKTLLFIRMLAFHSILLFLLLPVKFMWQYVQKRCVHHTKPAEGSILCWKMWLKPKWWNLSSLSRIPNWSNERLHLSLVKHVAHLELFKSDARNCPTVEMSPWQQAAGLLKIPVWCRGWGGWGAANMTSGDVFEFTPSLFCWH